MPQKKGSQKFAGGNDSAAVEITAAESSEAYVGITLTKSRK